ncbi:3-oxoadipate enol-lactonase [Dongia sp.]|uniref:3-oxoadipate enol-lactonase n=1 Tax=Dongia sp. TaxID=1977262 RepID=UPI0035AE4C07
MGQLVANGISVHVNDAGPQDRPAIVMSNSLAADLGMWDAQAEALAKTYRVLRFDARGHGRTQATPGDYTLDLLVDDVIALLDAHGIQKAHFVGLSLGGMIGQRIAERAPDRIASLVLCATFAEAPFDLWDQRVTTVRKSGIAPLIDGTLLRWFTPAFAETSPHIVDKARRMIAATSVDGYAGCAAAIRDMDLKTAPESIKMPTLILAAENDPSATPEMMKHLHARISGAEFQLLPACAHVFTMERPTDATGAIGSFLERNWRA